MKLRIPNSPEQISIKTFCEYHAAKSDIEKVAIITKSNQKFVGKLQAKSINEIIAIYERVLSKEDFEFQTIVKSRCDFRSKKLGFIPNLETMEFSAYLDIDALAKSIWKGKGKTDWSQLPRLMAILYRPLKYKFRDKYSIEKYDSEKINDYIKYIEHLPVSLVYSSLVFFLSLKNELRENSQLYMIQAMKKELQQLTNS